MLVAAVLEVLLDLWTRRLTALKSKRSGRAKPTVDRARAAEEGAKAAGHLLTMLIRGLDYLPPVEFEFGDLLDAVILADKRWCRKTTSGTAGPGRAVRPLRHRAPARNQRDRVLRRRPGRST